MEGFLHGPTKLETFAGLLSRYICFYNAKIKLETTIYKLQCSGVQCKDPCFGAYK